MPKYLLNAEITSALNEFNRLIISLPYSGEYGSTFLALSSSSIFSISDQLESYEETISSLRIDVSDKNTDEIIAEFNSIGEAARAFGNYNYNANIARVCNGKRKTALGYKWKYK